MRPFVRTTVVTSPGLLAASRLRWQAAHQGPQGPHMLSLEQLAQTLAGGFYECLTLSTLRTALTPFLKDEGAGQLALLADLPGTATGIARSLMKAWQAGLSLEALKDQHPRLAHMAYLQAKALACVPNQAKALPHLIDLAMANLSQAPQRVGEVVLVDLWHVAPCWHPLLIALAEVVPVTWKVPLAEVPTWVKGSALKVELMPASEPHLSIEGAATPYEEVIAALAWAHQLVASGVSPSDIGIASTQPELYAEAFLALREEAAFSLHFVEGVPLVHTFEGQQLAALGDILSQGLTKTRLLRLAALNHDSAAFKALPKGWPKALPEVPLSTAASWQHVLRSLSPQSFEDSEPQAYQRFHTLIGLLLRPEEPLAIGEALFKGPTLRVWASLVQGQHLASLPQRLLHLKRPDPQGSLKSVLWGSAGQLATHPRPYMRLLGLNAQQWPRPLSEDTFLPSHLVDPKHLEVLSPNACDKQAFALFVRHTSQHLALSYARRSAAGRVLEPSPLLSGLKASTPSRPKGLSLWRESEFFGQHLALFQAEPRTQKALACWQQWQSPTLEPADGALRAEHPLIVEALARVQSASSLGTLLSNPQNFVWSYVLGWRVQEVFEEGLSYRPRELGTFIHAFLEQSHHHLSQNLPLTPEHIERLALQSLSGCAPLSHGLWQGMLRQLHELSQHALEAPEGFVRYHEVAFGGAKGRGREGGQSPWECADALPLPGTSLRLSGHIDRVDLSADRQVVRVIDYKTGSSKASKPAQLSQHLQSALYAFAAHHLLAPSDPEAEFRVETGLYYVKSERAPKLSEWTSLGDYGEHLNTVVDALKAGAVLPSPLALTERNPLALALPAQRSTTYAAQKRKALRASFPTLARLWGDAS